MITKDDFLTVVGEEGQWWSVVLVWGEYEIEFDSEEAYSLLHPDLYAMLEPNICVEHEDRWAEPDSEFCTQCLYYNKRGYYY